MTSKERKLDVVEQANFDAIMASSMSKENKKKALAFFNCQPKDIHLFVKGTPNVPKERKKKYNPNNYDDNGNKIND